MTIHESITIDRIIEVARACTMGDEMVGLCIACGEDAYGVEPDARGYTCESCGEAKVFGGELLLLMTCP